MKAKYIRAASILFSAKFTFFLHNKKNLKTGKESFISRIKQFQILNAQTMYANTSKTQCAWYTDGFLHTQIWQGGHCAWDQNCLFILLVFVHILKKMKKKKNIYIFYLFYPLSNVFMRESTRKSIVACFGFNHRWLPVERNSCRCCFDFLLLLFLSHVVYCIRDIDSKNVRIHKRVLTNKYAFMLCECIIGINAKILIWN